MNKLIKFTFISLLIFILVSCGNSLGKVAGEYEGDISFGENSVFELGINKEDMPIFKEADKAFNEILKEEEEAFKEIQKQFNLNEVSKKDWNSYKTYGWQLSTEDENLKMSGARISQFFDIYENSFISKDKQ